MSDNIAKAEAMRETAERLVTDKKFMPWCLDYQREMAAAWLNTQADEILYWDEA